MCGIIAITNKNLNVTDEILSSLQRLEYRGYDSAGIAVIDKHGKIQFVKEVGKIVNLAQSLNENPLDGKVGIGHTRWATHGKVQKENAHPFIAGHVAIVHNGIIENYSELKEYLTSQGEKFKSETDTEVIPVYINFLLKNGENFKDAFKKVVQKLKGAYAIAGICSYEPDTIAFAKYHSPLVVGFGKNACVVGSDAFSIVSVAQKMSYLQDGDYGFIDSKGKLELFDKNHSNAKRELVQSNLKLEDTGKNGYKHYMLKEIYEQPEMLKNILTHYTSSDGIINLPNLEKIDFSQYKRINIIACGTSYYAGMTSSYYFEKYAQMPFSGYISSEYRYQDLVIEKDTLYIAISQSGETADTIGAIKEIKSKNGFVLALVNAKETTMQNISDAFIESHAGKEISVASTKAFTSQVLVLAILALKIGIEKQTIQTLDALKVIQDFRLCASKVSGMLNDEKFIENINKISHTITQYSSLIYLGRGICTSVAAEGSLKMKELSYIHSEALASGELKHGSVALIDRNIAVIAMVPSAHLFDKSASNIESIFARDGRVILISDEAGEEKFAKFSHQILGSINIPKCEVDLVPILYTIPAQLLAYYTALAKGNDVDQPRNLAKSVTVE